MQLHRGVIEKYACNVSEGIALNFKGESKFRIVEPAAERGALDKRIGERLVDRTVCVTGAIEQGGPGDHISPHSGSTIWFFTLWSSRQIVHQAERAR